MKTRKLFLSLLTLLMTLSVLTTTTFAAVWYLDDAELTVVANADGQRVYQGGDTVGVEDDNPIITQHDPYTQTSNSITLESDDGKTVIVTIRDLYICSDYEEGVSDPDDEYSLIDVVGDTKAEITLEEWNVLESEGAENKAIVHVGAGDVTFKGDGVLEVYTGGHGAMIGSDNGEDFTGKIHITDEASVVTHDESIGDGAAIGSGQGGDFAGTIQIDGNAYVDAESNDRGAGIGAGEGEGYYDADGNLISWGGDFCGTVIIEGNAVVYAIGNDDSAGIGSGENGTFSGGSITIGGNAEVYAEGDDEGPAIGAADDTAMNGTIIIKDNAYVHTNPGNLAPDIGNEGTDKSPNGNIFIQDNARVENQYGNYLEIGGDNSSSEMGVYISGNATLNGKTVQEILNGEAEDEVFVHSVYGPNGKPLPKKADEPKAKPVSFRVYDENNCWLPYVSKTDGDTLIVKVEGDYAKLMGEHTELMLLKAEGYKRIRLETDRAACEMELDKVLENSQPWEKIALTLDGKKESLTIGGEYRGELLD